VAEADGISDEDLADRAKAQEMMERMTQVMADFQSAMEAIDPGLFSHRVVDDPGPPLEEAEIAEMCDKYFEYHEYIARRQIRAAPDDLGENSERIGEMVERNPERLWPLLVALIERSPSDEARMFVAAGPLEDLVNWHGERFLDRPEHEAIQNRSFHSALRGIWGWEKFPDPVRDRLFAVLTPEWDDLADKRTAAR
jgi:hypothetical protein